jgi:hypothetical protein
VPKLIFSSETLGCGATIRVNSGEEIAISIAQAGVRVRSTKGFLGSFFGATLYEEKNVYRAAKTAMALYAELPTVSELPRFKNPVLTAFATAVWYCPSAARVSVLLNRTAEQDKPVETITQEVSFKAVADYGSIMETQGTAFLDISKLPLPKEQMKEVLKIAWQFAPDDQVRESITFGYINLRCFQPGIGDRPVDGALSSGPVTKESLRQDATSLSRWMELEQSTQAEREQLSDELNQFISRR